MARLIILLAALDAAIPASAASGASSALEVARAFCNRGGGFDRKALYTGEMRERFADKPTLGESFKPDIKLSVRELFNNGKVAMAAVEAAREGTDELLDYYVFLEKADRWRISAVRTLWLSGVFYMALEELEKKSKRTPDEEHHYQQSRLTIRNDRFMKRYLQENLDRFNRLVQLHGAGQHEAEKAAAVALKIRGNLESRRGDGVKGVIAYTIGGMLDNEVGFLYVPSGARPPDMSPGRYILVDHITGPWYLYKTT